MLAVKLQNLDAVKVLVDAHCSPKLSSGTHIPSAFELACALKNRQILEVLLNSVQKLKQYFMDLHKDEIFRTLEALPDFSVDLHFECMSAYIPFLNYVSPSDTYKINKRGSNLRLDMTLVGFKKLQSVRGNLSVVYKGRDSKNPGELLLIDHDRKFVRNIFEDSTENTIERDLDAILKDDKVLKKYKPEHFKMTREHDRDQRAIQKKFESYTAEKYSIQTVYTMTKYKRDLLSLRQNLKQLKSFKSFEEYLNSDMEPADFNVQDAGQNFGLSHR